MLVHFQVPWLLRYSRQLEGEVEVSASNLVVNKVLLAQTAAMNRAAAEVSQVQAQG